MASGHVNRANRPNTWPLRPTPQSEDSPCQPGAVHTWAHGDIGDVRPSAIVGEGDGHQSANRLVSRCASASSARPDRGAPVQSALLLLSGNPK